MSTRRSTKRGLSCKRMTGCLNDAGRATSLGAKRRMAHALIDIVANRRLVARDFTGHPHLLRRRMIIEHKCSSRLHVVGIA